jgi:hypothetical protein
MTGKYRPAPHAPETATSKPVRKTETIQCWFSIIWSIALLKSITRCIIVCDWQIVICKSIRHVNTQIYLLTNIFLI